jgi:trk system potassium uptake protein TrkA
MIVVGCGQVGSSLAYRLYKMGHEVVVIDRNKKAFENLLDDFRGRTVNGDVLTRQVLRRAEVREADALFALTGFDPLNALLAYIARSKYSVMNVAARNNDPRHLALQESLGVPVIATPIWITDNLSDLLPLQSAQPESTSLVPHDRHGNRSTPMKVLIIGGEATGEQLAALLINQKINVCLVENRPDILAQLHRELPTGAIYEDNPMDLRVLEHAGIRDANVLVACTSSDADNVALCYLAKTGYQVPRTIGRINNPRHAWLFSEEMHVNVALNESSILAHLIEEEMTLGDMMTLLKLRRGRYALVEIVIPPGAKAVGTAIKDTSFPENCVIATIFRKGETIVPSGATIFEVGDEVLAITDSAGREGLEELFGEPELVDSEEEK